MSEVIYDRILQGIKAYEAKFGESADMGGVVEDLKTCLSNHKKAFWQNRINGLSYEDASIWLNLILDVVNGKKEEGTISPLKEPTHRTGTRSKAPDDSGAKPRKSK